ncbi:hypothetical protein G6F56_006127 [Rhizopus delemar]|nr:hypothetical protein G6F56_006127 [Rhizopus delemar]
MTLFLNAEQSSNARSSLNSISLEEMKEDLKGIESRIDDCFQSFNLEESLLSSSSAISLTQETEPLPIVSTTPSTTGTTTTTTSTPTITTTTTTTTTYTPTTSLHTTNATYQPSIEFDTFFKAPSKLHQGPVLQPNGIERSSRPPMPSYYSDIPANHRTASSCVSFNSFASENLGLKKYTTSKKRFLPATTRENLMTIRQETEQTQDPQVQLDFAIQLLDAAGQVGDGDSERVQRARERLVMEAQRLVKKLAGHSGIGKQGYPEAQFFLANCYGTGSMGLTMDPERAFGLYLQGSKQNHPPCTFRAAVCYEVGAGTKRDRGHAMQLYRKAANLGDPIAMYKLGMILLKGFLNQPINPREGIIWLKRAAEHADEDHPHALYELALVYEKEGIPSVIPDANYARELFTRAAQYGYAAAQFRMGQAYENGFLNCPVDPRRSIAWYSKAAEQGDIHAEFALSGWYLTGADGVLPQSDAQAYMWARRAADKGFAKAEYAVGYYTETGTGTTQNIEEAAKWYKLAAAQKHSKASQRLLELKYEGAGPHQHHSELPKQERNSECEIM